MPPPSDTSKASPQNSSDDGNTVQVARKPTAEEEKNFLENKARKARNRSFKQDMQERKKFADHAYGITQAWVGFLMVLTIAQIALKPLNLGLTETAFVTVFTTTTASIFGFWLLVGRYLFPSKSE
ncbi:MAG: hypothetical protein EOO38_06070 [Cytophagaceae bacterium]|nr:MAG: hypothetical protein EOO38_06070 [Cytophagaceae bacterium]